MIEVLRAGPLALVEDAGRHGFASVGVSPSGAFDRGAFVDGALLVGNDPDRHAAIEITLGGFSLRVLAGGTIAFTGAVCPLTVDGRAENWGHRLRVNRGQVVTLGMPATGLRSYLSVAGGVDVAPVLGSRSADVLSGLGPAPLKPGDLLGVGAQASVGFDRPSPRLSTDAGSPAVRESADGPDGALVLLAGPQTDWLDDRSALAAEWTISQNSNRIGVRLDGSALSRREGEIPSQPLVRGAVQLPASGHPVVFGPDHPTTGGYPVVAVLTDESCDRLGQCRPGDRVHLAWTR